MKRRFESDYPDQMKEFRILTPAQLSEAVYQRMHSSLEPTEYGRNLDWWFFPLGVSEPLNKNEVVSLEDVSERVDHLLNIGKRLAYWSGGFDLSLNHSVIIGALNYLIPKDVVVVMGIEPDSYIRKKGREPKFSQEIRLSAVATLLKERGKLGAAFPVPENQNGFSTYEFYSLLTRGIGMYRRENCYHLYTQGDPFKEQKVERMLDPQEWCELPNVGGLSTTEILRMH